MAAGAGTSAGDGFSVLDGAALVAGAAVASVHVREALARAPMGPGWLVFWAAFGWLALTSAGPFLYLTRRYARGLPGYPGVGDRLWGVLGLPWLAATAAHAVTPAGAGAGAGGGAVGAWLVVGLGLSSLTAVVAVWATWVSVPADRAAANFSAPWTNRVGLVLAVAWPIQVAVGMVVIG